MKNSKYTKVAVIVMVILFVVISVLGCVTHHHHSNKHSHKVPPGKAKKMSGSKSARSHAPGHQKKH
ncbi:hypothetical protein GON26_10655 [Flavobacterium sp. GA093]|uniref:Quinol oxidase subunit 4 n=1 Tax=Flavobacterium hydrocarbonoxydans TaxID=2683249 RepID=A0A6I4NUR2_9FLAO|nr:hypothetical protein [Flavobacterium hydrocarbonoxydans]MWB94827.1 hypothetical protein [Flavobacterium hydrocarbonoxydans]